MKQSGIDWIKPGKWPADWADYEVVDMATGEIMADVVEASVKRGFVKQIRRDKAGNPRTTYDRRSGREAVSVRRLRGCYAIQRKPTAAEPEARPLRGALVKGLSYIVAGKTPGAEWMEVIDVVKDRPLVAVVEASISQGWALVADAPRHQAAGVVKLRRISGRLLELRWLPDTPADIVAAIELEAAPAVGPTRCGQAAGQGGDA